MTDPKNLSTLVRDTARGTSLSEPAPAYRYQASYNVPGGAYVCFAKVGEQRRTLALGAADEAGVQGLALLAAGMSPNERTILARLLNTGALAELLLENYFGPPSRLIPPEMVLYPETLIERWAGATSSARLGGLALGDPETAAKAPTAVKYFLASALAAVVNAGIHGGGKAPPEIRATTAFATLRVTRGVVGYDDFRLGFWLTAFAEALSASITKAAKHIQQAKDAAGGKVAVHTIAQTGRAFFETLAAALSTAALPQEALLIALGEVRRRITVGTFSDSAVRAGMQGLLEGLLANLNFVVLAMDTDTPVTPLGPEEVFLLEKHLQRLTTALSPAFRLWEQMPATAFAAMFSVERHYRPGEPVPVSVTVSRNIDPAPLITAAQTAYLASSGLGNNVWSLMTPLSSVLRGLPSDAGSAAQAWEHCYGAGVRNTLAELATINNQWHNVSALSLVSSVELWLLALVHAGGCYIETHSTSAWEQLHSKSLMLQSPLPGLDSRPAVTTRELGADGSPTAYDVSVYDPVALSILPTLRVPLSDPRLALQLSLVGLAESVTQEVAEFTDPLLALTFGALRPGIGRELYPVSVFEPPARGAADSRPASFPYIQLAAGKIEAATTGATATFVAADPEALAFEGRLTEGRDHNGRRRTIKVSLPDSVAETLVHPRHGTLARNLVARIAAGDLVTGPHVAARAIDSLRMGAAESRIVRMQPFLLPRIHLEAVLRMHQLLMQLPADTMAGRHHAQRYILLSWLRAASTPYAAATIGAVLRSTSMLAFVAADTVPGAIIIAAVKLAVTREILAAITGSTTAYRLWQTFAEELDLNRALDENALLLLPRPVVAPLLPGGEGAL